MESFLNWLTGHWVFLLIAAIVLLIVCVAHYSIAGCIDLEDFFIDEYGWLTVITVVAVEALVYVLVYFKWQNWFFWIIAAIVLIIACVAHYFIADCCGLDDFFIDGFGWLTVFIVVTVEALTYVFIYFGWQNWFFWIIAAIVLIIACVAHYFIADCCGLEDFFTCEYGWVTIIAVAVIAPIIYGFIYWIWWAMLIIMSVAAVIAAVTVYLVVRHENADYDGETDYDEDDDELTRYKCPNCGAAISKVYTDGEIGYKCAYCNTTFEKKDMKLVIAVDGAGYIEIDDFEEEYFNACERMDFRPYNFHSEKQIERKRDKLKKMIDNYEQIYDDVYFSRDAEEILEEAYDFFIENESEIKEYFDKYGETEIKNRYEAYESQE